MTPLLWKILLVFDKQRSLGNVFSARWFMMMDHQTCQIVEVKIEKTFRTEGLCIQQSKTVQAQNRNQSGNAKHVTLSSCKGDKSYYWLTQRSSPTNP